MREAKRRWALWGLQGGREVEAWEGDFCELREVAKVLPQADVVVSSRVSPISTRRRADSRLAFARLVL